jgi:hypothetical protein
VVPKIGYAIGFMNLGTVQVLPGKTPPVVTPEGTFNQGDSVSATIGGLILQAGAAASLRLSRSIGLRVDGGLQYAHLSNFQVKAGEVTLEKGSSSLVQPGTTTAASLTPKATATGPYALMALTVAL